jgi:hypothetical protein
MSTASRSFLALSSLTTLETANNNGFSNPHNLYYIERPILHL